MYLLQFTFLSEGIITVVVLEHSGTLFSCEQVMGIGTEFPSAIGSRTNRLGGEVVVLFFSVLYGGCQMDWDCP